MNHVLVVDDEAEIRSSLEEILAEEGYTVATAATAAEAKVLIEDAPYDVVLLDIWLPDRDGLDVLADIHSLDAEKRPVLLFPSEWAIAYFQKQNKGIAISDLPFNSSGGVTALTAATV